MNTRTNTGKVKFFNENKGFGFITDTTDPTKDYFFNYTKVIDKDIQKDDVVTFDVGHGKKGLQAINVKRVI